MPFALLQAVALPLVVSTAMLMVRPGKHRLPAWAAVATLGYTTALLAAAAIRVYGGEPLLERYSLGPLLNVDLLGDGLSLPTAIIVNLICLALALYSMSYVDHRIELLYGDLDERTYGLYYRRFFLLYLYFPTGFLGVAFCTNVLAVYFFLELLTIIPLYFIMAQFGYSDYITRYKVALMCLYWGVAGATLFLIGILWSYIEVGSFELQQLSQLTDSPAVTWIALIILAGLAVKLAVVPFQAWMPWVHAEHPTCIAGLLAIYANIAAYVAVRVLILPLGEAIDFLSLPLMVFALITMLYGAFLTLSQTDIKRFCACSTISQISYSVFGIAAMTTWGVQGGMFYFLSHILGKAILFSTAGILVYQTGIRDWSRMGGLWSRMKLTAVLWICAALILSALPTTSGFVGKWMIFVGSFQRYAHEPIGLTVTILAVLSTLLTLVYTFWVGIRIFFGQSQLQKTENLPADPPLAMSLPLLGLAVCAFTLGLYPDLLLTMLASALEAF